MQKWYLGDPYEFKSGLSSRCKCSDDCLVAYALVHHCMIVTLEVNSETKRKIPIPIICEAFGVRWLNTFDMLRLARIQFT
ncbi:MAG: DUF4411 family protein [Chlorobiaceae bacterium]